jgi:hypothetical protein
MQNFWDGAGNTATASSGNSGAVIRQGRGQWMVTGVGGGCPILVREVITKGNEETQRRWRNGHIRLLSMIPEGATLRD